MASTTPSAQSSPRAPQSASSTQANFQPRQEFIKDPIVPHDFGLVSFNGSEILRLANFPVNVVNVIRRTLEHEIRHYREDTELVVSELVLAGKPFSGRSKRQEQILLAIFTAIFSQQYYLLSSIDYGRIYLDKLTLTFARNLTPASGPQPERRVAFGISFSSMTQLRVVSPPLPLTPAILRVVRSAWPHGVVSEKRDGDACYAFKLKGYSLFQHSTFEVDSLTHILEIFKEMDAHGITLVTSINLSKRSRIQDFWVFSAPAPRSQSEASPIERPKKTLAANVPVDNSDAQSHSMILDEAARKTKFSPKPNPSIGHSRSSSQPNGSPLLDGSRARNAALDGRRGKGEIPPPLTGVPREYASQQTSVTPFPRGPQDDPRKNGRGPSDFHPQRNLPPEFPPFPPDSLPTKLYPTDHKLSVPQIIYTSPSQEHQYRTVPSGAFHIQPPSPMNLEPPSESRPRTGRPKSWSTQGSFMPDPPDGDEDFNPGLLPAAVFRDTRLTEDTWAPSNDISSTQESAIGKLAQTTWTKKGPMKSTTTIEPILEKLDGEVDSPGLARSPKQVDPELYPEDPGQMRSECASLDYIPPPVVNLQAETDQSPKDKSGALRQRRTTEAAAAEVLSKSRHRATVEVPMTIRNSDNMSPGGHWVLIHEPGRAPTSKDIPLPTAKPVVHSKLPAPLKIIPATTRDDINVIPTDGDQSAYPRFPPVKDKGKKSVFPWPRSRKNSRESKMSKKESGEHEFSPKSRFKEIDPVLHGDEATGQIDERDSLRASDSDDSSSSEPRYRSPTPVMPITPIRSHHASRPDTPESPRGINKLRSRMGSRGPSEVGVPEKRLIID